MGDEARKEIKEKMILKNERTLRLKKHPELPKRCPRCGNKSFFCYPPSSGYKCSNCGWTPSHRKKR